MSRLLMSRRGTSVGWFVALVLCLTASAASAETLLMPKRDFLGGANEVVWGVTTQANGTAYVIDYGDGSPQGAGNLADRSYIAFNHTFPDASVTYTIQLCVGPAAVIPGCPGELATVNVAVYDDATLSDFDLRGLNINRAIQNALRNLWTTQVNRAGNFPAGLTTNWSAESRGGAEQAMTALAVLAFENHGYLLANDGSAPTGVYEKYVVQRGLYFIASTSSQVSLTLQTLSGPPNRDPCVGPGIEPVPCVGIYDPSDAGYATAVLALPFAGSTALNRVFPAGLGGASGVYITGKTFREVLQRIMNALAWGQNDGPGVGRGGWIYNFSNNINQQSDGSTIGWDMLALLDASAAGISIPAFVKTEFQTYALEAGRNTNGSFDYRADGNQATLGNVNFQKGGILLQSFYYVGKVGTGDADVNTAVNYLNDRWFSAQGGDYTGWNCGNPVAPHTGNNIPCAYGMFNAFKGLKLHGVQTLSNVGRPAGPGPIPANDWWAAYQDWLVLNQTNPLSTGGGNWTALGFSCCQSNATSLGLLILSSVTLIQPDPNLFSTVGLSPLTDENPPKTSHTVTATAISSDKQPVPGATINFTVKSGPNAGKAGQSVTNGAGQATFTYTDDQATGPWPKTDVIQAAIGTLKSNEVTKVWVLRCDANGDGLVTNADLLIIRNANGQPASSMYDPRDGNADGSVNVSDYRYCQLRLTPVG